MPKELNRLYNQEKTTQETYTFDINKYSGEYELEKLENRKVIIIFINGKFSSAEFYFSCPYTKAQWKVLEAISQKIREIENAKTQSIE